MFREQKTTKGFVTKIIIKLITTLPTNGWLCDAFNHINMFCPCVSTLVIIINIIIK